MNENPKERKITLKLHGRENLLASFVIKSDFRIFHCIPLPSSPLSLSAFLLLYRCLIKCFTTSISLLLAMHKKISKYFDIEIGSNRSIKREEEEQREIVSWENTASISKKQLASSGERISISYLRSLHFPHSLPFSFIHHRKIHSILFYLRAFMLLIDVNCFRSHDSR